MGQLLTVIGTLSLISIRKDYKITNLHFSFPTVKCNYNSIDPRGKLAFGIQMKIVVMVFKVFYVLVCMFLYDTTMVLSGYYVEV